MFEEPCGDMNLLVICLAGILLLVVRSTTLVDRNFSIFFPSCDNICGFQEFEEKNAIENGLISIFPMVILDNPERIISLNGESQCGESFKA